MGKRLRKSSTTNKRAVRKGEYVCNCDAYKFPHRMTGGRCSGYSFVVDTWEANWGSNECEHCPAFQQDEGFICEVVEGRERVSLCRALEEFIRVNEIKVYKRRKR